MMFLLVNSNSISCFSLTAKDNQENQAYQYSPFSSMESDGIFCASTTLSFLVIGGDDTFLSRLWGVVMRNIVWI
jgi:hypothetical protein